MVLMKHIAVRYRFVLCTLILQNIYPITIMCDCVESVAVVI